MARISSYSQDPNLEGADRVIGTDASQANATVNFSLDSLGDFYARTGAADATRLGFRFNIGGIGQPGFDLIPNSIYFNSANLAELTTITVAPQTLSLIHI